MAISKIESLINQVIRHNGGWHQYRATIYKVDISRFENDCSHAPNAETKKFMQDKIIFMNQLLAGYVYLATFNRNSANLSS